MAEVAREQGSAREMSGTPERLPPLTEAELVEIGARRVAHEIEIRGCLCVHCVPNLATLFTLASEDAGRLLSDLRRAHARIADLEAQIAATAEAHREDQRRVDELAGVPG